MCVSVGDMAWYGVLYRVPCRVWCGCVGLGLGGANAAGPGLVPAVSDAVHLQHLVTG